MHSITGNPLDGGTELDRLKDVSIEDDPQDLADAVMDLHRRRQLQAMGVWLAGTAGETRTSPADLIASTGTDGTVRFWTPGHGKEEKAYNWNIGRVTAVAFAPDGLTCAAGGENGQVVVWDVDA